MTNKNIIKITIGIWISIIVMCVFIGVKNYFRNYNHSGNNDDIFNTNILYDIEDELENMNYKFDDNDNYDYSNFKEYDETTIKETVNNVKVEWINGNVLIQPTISNEIKIVHQTNKDISNIKKMMISIQGDQLIVKDRRMYRTSNYPSSDVIVYLPEKVYNDISLHTVAADIEAQTHLHAKVIHVASVSGDIDVEATADNMSFDTVSGDIEGSNIESGYLKFNTISGDAQISGAFNDIELNSVSGTVEIKSSKMISKISANSVSGNYNISIPENDGFIVNFSKLLTNGNFESNFPLNINLREATYKNSSAQYNITTISGKLHITKY